MIHPSLVPATDAFRSRNDATDPRVGDLVRTLEDPGQLKEGDVVLLGVRNEEGVLANHGRAGAAQGPGGFRQAFFKLTAPALLGRACWDAGDLPESLPYATRFEVQGEVVAALLRRGALPVVVGGGHDCSYGNYLGLAALGDQRPPAVVGVDAHLDMRPDPGANSGNPFFRMLEHGLSGEDLALVGLIPWVNAQAHHDYAQAKAATLHWLEPGGEAEALRVAQAALNRFQGRGRRVLATFDLDAFTAAAIPGVSAPNPWGIGADLGLQLARAFGHAPGVACLDLMELAPPLDPTGRSARMAAFLAAAFLAGLADRPVVQS
ncbi:MAG TPA: arginase family protein [Holophagaceae bacterium]|nr:arginase family protein [Holophagaceae bacterium]